LEDSVNDPGEEHDGRRSQRVQRRFDGKKGRDNRQPNDRA
jgi:hypothetical protein